MTRPRIGDRLWLTTLSAPVLVLAIGNAMASVQLDDGTQIWAMQSSLQPIPPAAMRAPWRPSVIQGGRV